MALAKSETITFAELQQQLAPKFDLLPFCHISLWHLKLDNQAFGAARALADGETDVKVVEGRNKSGIK